MGKSLGQRTRAEMQWLSYGADDKKRNNKEDDPKQTFRRNPKSGFQIVV
jgi:hypothetical protein